VTLGLYRNGSVKGVEDWYYLIHSRIILDLLFGICFDGFFCDGIVLSAGWLAYNFLATGSHDPFF